MTERPAPAIAHRIPLPGRADPRAVAGWLRGEPRPVALQGEWVGVQAILTSHPLAVLPDAADPFAALDAPPLAPPPEGSEAVFGGGWIGWLGFALSAQIEQLPPAPPGPAGPGFDLAFHDHAVVCDADGRWYFEALWSEARSAVLAERQQVWEARLRGAPPPQTPSPATTLAPLGAGLAGHRVAVAETIERIARGEISQANLCLALAGHGTLDPVALWQASAPARYGALIGSAEPARAIVSLSPERFLRRRGAEVSTEPIKGTAPATEAERLRVSAKDRAENVMIVDLMRNDLGRVCRYGTVEVSALCEVVPGPGVVHLQSQVRGTLRAGVGDAALLRATFPPGSVTGAPKRQAIRTIHALEATARNAYCGAIGFASPLAGLELSVAIRTFELAGGQVRLGAGGGIVADSDPDAEVAEVLLKARGACAAAGLRLHADAASCAPGGPHIPPPADAPRPDPTAGLLETMPVGGGVAGELTEHLARLRRSAAALGVPVPAELAARVEQAAAALGDGALRVELCASGVQLASRPLPAPAPVGLTPVSVPGGLGAHKWRDRRLIDAHTHPGVTPLLCDLDGTVLEAGYAAVLLVEGRSLIAPPADGRALPSLSASRLMALAAARGWPTRIEPFDLERLRRADAIVLTSSLRGPHLGELGERPPGAEAIVAELRMIYPGAS